MPNAKNPNRYSTPELARKLACRDSSVHAEVDRLGLPYVTRDGVDGNGNPITRRVYLRAPIDAALDEMGRKSQRGVA